jgi:single-strand DNA-binding protein
MANEPPITIVGNVTADAELRFVPSGQAVANFTVAQTPRTKRGDEWEDGETMFFRVNVWRDQAEHVAESIKRGMRVVVTGRMKVRSYDATDGSGKRTSIEVEADEVGVALRYGTATFNKAERVAAGAPAAGPDPWATPPAAAPGWGPPPAAAAPTWAGAPAPAGPPPTAPPQAGPPPGWTAPQYPEPPY